MIFDLTKVRNELESVLSTLPDDELNFAPAQGMKTYRDLIREIGAMEYESLVLLGTGVAPQWEECEAHIDGGTKGELLAQLSSVRAKLLAWIEQGDLAALVPLPVEWHPYYDGPEIVAEELIRWVTRHEYYHLGQIITYRWIQGSNPYRKE